MLVINTKEEIKDHVNNLKKQGREVGLVPTMGALHKGHLSLIKMALKENDVVVVSIFVNPTQFDNQEDLTNYPRTLEADIALLKTVQGIIIVFAPTALNIYDANIVSESFDFDGLEFEMEGKYRKGHFNGVGTIVKKLLEAVIPSRAYFGEKDYQQLQIIKTLVKKYRIPVEIIGCPIQREANGLALSSRNELLSKDIRNEAAFIYKILTEAKQQFGTKSVSKIVNWVILQFDKNEWFTLEYFEIADAATLKPIRRKYKEKNYRGFIAVYANQVRLIDNIALN